MRIEKSEKMWIEKSEKNNYMDSSQWGLRFYSTKKVNLDLKINCLKYCSWLRKKFWFPIRIKLHLLSYESFITYDDEKKIAIFRYQTTWDKKSKKEKEFPNIYITSGKFERQLKKHDFFDTLFYYFHLIAHELTHYFQWYFYEFEKRTNRSLEREANSWGDYLAYNFIEEIKEHKGANSIDGTQGGGELCAKRITN